MFTDLPFAPVQHFFYSFFYGTEGNDLKYQRKLFTTDKDISKLNGQEGTVQKGNEICGSLANLKL